MAKLRKGIFGPISGKLGPLVGAMWRSIPYVRMAPKVKKKKKARSVAQIANEQKFKFVNDWLEPFHDYVNVGFLNLSTTMTEINLAFSENYHQAITGVYPNLGVDYTKVVLSKGVLPPLHEPAISLIATDTIELTWGQTNRPLSQYNDQVILVLYSPVLKIVDGFIGGTKRAMKKCSFKFDEELIGEELEVYVSATSVNRKMIANSIYLGKLIP